MRILEPVIVDAASRHLFERRRESLVRHRVAAVHGYLQQQIERRRMRKLRLRAESAVARIELVHARGGNLVDEGRRQRALHRRKNLRLAQWPPSRSGRLQRLLRRPRHTRAIASSTLPMPGRP